ncbi:MAG TPA: preprotein translocase subunit SecE [Cytophagales bacterium]|nr:preprotein translocase subunit SecE [Cytophagales bacterium]
MNKVISFFKESYDEMFHKVSWPKYKELQGSAILVLIASLIFALFVGLIDFLLENGMDWIYRSF